MTTLTAGPGHEAGHRLGMTWITWRQHRAALAGATVLLGTFAVVLAVTGLRMQSAYAALTRSGCQFSATSVASHCGRLWGAYYNAGYPLTGNVPLVGVVLAAVPVLIGMFVGAPLLASEYEAGTVRFVWTQTAGRTRWVTAKLWRLGVAIAAAGCAFGALAGWWLVLIDRTISYDRWQPEQFGLTTVTFAGWMLLMFTAGVFAGTVTRHAVPAMAVTGAAGAGLLWLSIEKLTANLTRWSPLTAPGRMMLDNIATPVSPGNGLVSGYLAVGPPGSWILRTWFDGPHGPIPYDANSLNPLWNLKPAAAARWLARHHLTVGVSYQSPGRFWLFQGAEGAAMVLLALLLAAATVWMVRRRAV